MHVLGQADGVRLICAGRDWLREMLGDDTDVETRDLGQGHGGRLLSLSYAVWMPRAGGLPLLTGLEASSPEIDGYRDGYVHLNNIAFHPERLLVLLTLYQWLAVGDAQMREAA